MNFNLSEEQNMLKDSVSRFVQNQYDFDTRRKFVGTEEGFSRENWQTFADLGWLSIPFTEAQGGFAGSVLDSMVVMEEMGKGLVAEPFVATVLLFGGLLSKSSNSASYQSTMQAIIDGEVQGAFAYLERQSRFEVTDIKTTATKNSDGYSLNGEKTVVFNGASADKIIVSARTSGEQFDQQGISLFMIDANAQGIEKTTYRLMDGQCVANIVLNDVQVSADQLVGELDVAYPLMQTVINEVMIAICAEALGIMQVLNETTIEYAKTRKQFGVAIGSFQALQHRMVDTFMACEQSQSLLLRAAGSHAAGNEESELDILALKVMIGRAGKLIGGEAIQIHGGMGITDELNVGHYVKRLMMINTTFGDADYHQQKFSAISNR
ncbi:MAG: acyl-CoA dehydrogenase family protein [Cycloclasticus sp.]